MKCLGFVALFGLLVAPHASPQTPTDEDQIRRTRAESNQAIARHDAPGILASLEDDYHVSVSSGPLFTGRAGNREAWAAQFAERPDAKYVRTPETVDVGTSTTSAAEVGRWEGNWTAGDGPTRNGGRYIAHWRKAEDGSWRLHSELFVPLFCEGPGCG